VAQTNQSNCISQKKGKTGVASTRPTVTNKQIKNMFAAKGKLIVVSTRPKHSAYGNLKTKSNFMFAAKIKQNQNLYFAAKRKTGVAKHSACGNKQIKFLCSQKRKTGVTQALGLR
jgi:hypothetical protein